MPKAPAQQHQPVTLLRVAQKPPPKQAATMRLAESGGTGGTARRNSDRTR